MLHERRVRRQGIRERVHKLREEDHLMKVLQRIGLKHKLRLDLKSRFVIKFYKNSLRVVMTREINREFKGKE